MRSESKLLIKAMVCERCIQVIKSALGRLGVRIVKISLGEVTVIDSLQLPERPVLDECLQSLGFQLLEDKSTKVIRTVKEIIHEVCSGEYDFPPGFRLSELLEMRMNKDYNSISAMFSLVEQKTIEHYFIACRIEKVKEFLVYSPLPLSEIAFKLNFSSVAHLSRQFKQLTGLNTSFFRKLKVAKLKVEHGRDAAPDAVLA